MLSLHRNQDGLYKEVKIKGALMMSLPDELERKYTLGRGNYLLENPC